MPTLILYFLQNYYFIYHCVSNFYVLIKLINTLFFKKLLFLNRPVFKIRNPRVGKIKIFLKTKLIENKKSKKKINLNAFATKTCANVQLFRNYWKRSYMLQHTRFPLLGQLISFYDWFFENKKLWFRTLMLENFIQKQNISAIENNILQKYIYFDQYFYFSKIKIKFNDFKMFIKITNLKLKFKNDFFYLFSKPYAILNNNSHSSAKFNPYSLTLHLMYKKFTKLFYCFSKNSFLLKKKKFNELFYFLIFQNKMLTNFFTLKNWLNYNINKLSANSSYFYFFSGWKKNLKKKINNISLNFISRSTKNLKLYLSLKKIKKFTKIFKLKKFQNKFSKLTLTLLFNSLQFQIKHKILFFKKMKSFKKIIKKNFQFLNIFNKKSKFFTKLRPLHSNNLLTKKNLNFIKFKSTSFRWRNESNYRLLNKFNKKKVFDIFKFPFFSSRYELNFITSHIGFLLTTEGYLNSYEIDYSTYNIKKKYYSFPLKNELQKFIIKRSLKTQTAQHNMFFEKTKQEAEFFETEDLFFKITKEFSNTINSKSTNQNFFFSHFSNLKSFFWNDQFQILENDEKENFSFFIRKIKFKPGYMTFWREARTVFKEILNLNFKYQKRLTNYVFKFNKILKFTLYVNTEMSFKNILQRSRFFFDDSTSDFFLAQGIFFINGVPCFNSFLQTYAGDFIQMIVHIKYYIFYRWLAYWILKKKQKLKIKTKKKLTTPVTEEDKTKTTRFPTWILFNKNLNEDSAKFLEIDFFTLSIFIVYEPFTWRDLNFYSTFSNRFSIINMYNWKYIT